jgi:hypothetical protein
MSKDQPTPAPGPDSTPGELREGVREAIASSLLSDLERRGARTGKRLVLSGLLGVSGALAVTWLVAAHPLDHHPHWHLAFYSTVWAGLLVVMLALGLLDVRTPRWPVGTAARVAVLALAIAGVCGWACPDQHFLAWWSSTAPGRSIRMATESPALSATCFGVAATAVVALVATSLATPRRIPFARGLAASSASIALLLAPGVALQTTDAETSVFGGWLTGVVLGAVAGVAGGIAMRRSLPAGLPPR